MADRSRWFESLSLPNLWRRVAGNDSLGILRSNSDRRDLVSLASDDEPAIAALPLRPDHAFTEDMPRPGAEYGATGTPIFGGFISGEDYNPKLDGAKALLVYDEMRRGDAQVNATMRVLKLPLQSSTWDIDPPDGSKDPQDQAIADFCASALFDDDAMAQPWNFVLNHILLKLDFGVSILEKIFTIGELGEIRYHRLAPRLPRTIFRWIIDPETGALEAVVQFAPKGGAFQYLTIPAMYAAVFVQDREGDNYFGRALALDTPIPTPDGWRTMGVLQPGDRVFDERGDIRHVVAKSPVWRNRPCYRVTFADGTSIVADEQHLWATMTLRERQYGHKPTVRSTKEIAESTKTSQGTSNHVVEWAQPLRYPKQHVLIPPYILGLWLGDGRTDGGVITTHRDDVAEMVSLIELYGYRTSVRGNGAKGGNGREVQIYGLASQLRALGLIGNKHIPEAYLRGSIDQRRALLAGLLDSDGTINSNGAVQFTNCNHQLIGGCAEIVRSLGQSCRVRRRHLADGRKHKQTSWEVQWNPVAPPFRLTRKNGRFVPRDRRTAHYIVSVEAVSPQETVCIEVDSPSHLFLAGEACVPTHNSVLRSAYQHWWRKQQLYNTDSVRLDRYGVGIPKASIAENHRPTDAELAELKRILRGLRSHERGYLIEPYGVTISILTPGSEAGGRGGAGGLIESVNHHNTMIANNILAGFLTANEQRRGALTHTQTLADIFQDSLQAIGDDTAGEIVQQLVRPLCDLNFDMTGRKYPVVRVSGLDAVDGQQLAVALQRLGPSQNNPRGFIQPDDEMEDWLREQYNAPPRRLMDTGAPTGSGGVEAPNPSGTAASPGTPGAAISSRPARSAPAVSPSGASRLAHGVPTTETGKGGQIATAKPATPDPKGDSGGSVVAAPLERAASQPPRSEPTSVPRPASPIAAGQPKVGPTSIQLDPMVDPINAPDQRPRSGLGNTRGVQRSPAAQTAYGFGGPRKKPAKPRLRAPWPEGPLGPIKAPPPPGGAMGAPPLGSDTRIGNNDGFPLGLRSDPVIVDGRAFSRAPTRCEEQILNFREIPDRLDAEKHALIGRLRSLRKTQRDRLIGDLVERDADPSTGAFTDLRPDRTPIPLANDVYLAIRAAQGRMAKYGALQVRSELHKQGAPVTAHGGRVELANVPQPRHLFVVRHGETDDDRPPERISSAGSVRLNETGRATGHALAQLFRDVSPLKIICSPLERAQETAALIADDRTDVTIVTDPEWTPWHLGELTGQTIDQAQKEISRLQANPDDAPEGGESWHAFTDRIDHARARILAASVTESGATIVLSHSWILRMTLDWLQGQPEDQTRMPPGTVLDLTVLPNGRVRSFELLPAVTTDTPPLHLATDPSARAAANKKAQLSSLVSSAQATARQLNDSFRATVLDAAIRIRRTGVRGPDLASKLNDEIDDAVLDRGLARAAGQEVNEAFGLGRATEASDLSDVIETVVYSALLDEATCDNCHDLDGTEWDAGDSDIVDTPNPECDGRDSCRCVLLFLTKQQNDAA